MKKPNPKCKKPQTQPSHPQNKKPQIHPYSLSLTIQPQAAWSRALWPCLAYQQCCKSLKIAWGHTVVVWSPLTLSVPWPHLQMLYRSAGLEGHSQALAADRSNVAASFVSETKQDRRLQLYKYKPNGFFWSGEPVISTTSVFHHRFFFCYLHTTAQNFRAGY